MTRGGIRHMHDENLNSKPPCESRFLSTNIYHYLKESDNEYTYESYR